MLYINYSAITWIVRITIISKPNCVFLTKLNQTHSEPDPNFFLRKKKLKPNHKKSIPHIPSSKLHYVYNSNQTNAKEMLQFKDGYRARRQVQDNKWIWCYSYSRWSSHLLCSTLLWLQPQRNFSIPLDTLQVISGTILRVRWPDQQCCNTEEQWLVNHIKRQSHYK